MFKTSNVIDESFALPTNVLDVQLQSYVSPKYAQQSSTPTIQKYHGFWRS